MGSSFSHLLLISVAGADAAGSVPALSRLGSCVLWATLLLQKTRNSFTQHPIECTPPPATPTRYKPKRNQHPSVTCPLLRKGCRAHRHPPPPPIYPFSPFSSACLSALCNLIIAGPHSYDLSPGMSLKPNRSGLQQGAQDGREGQGM